MGSQLTMAEFSLIFYISPNVQPFCHPSSGQVVYRHCLFHNVENSNFTVHICVILYAYWQLHTKRQFVISYIKIETKNYKMHQLEQTNGWAKWSLLKLLASSFVTQNPARS